jgi:hypothetical protein
MCKPVWNPRPLRAGELQNYPYVASARLRPFPPQQFDFHPAGSGLTQIPPAIPGPREEPRECAPRSFLSGTRPGKACPR